MNNASKEDAEKIKERLDKQSELTSVFDYKGTNLLGINYFRIKDSFAYKTRQAFANSKNIIRYKVTVVTDSNDNTNNIVEVNRDKLDEIEKQNEEIFKKFIEPIEKIKVDFYVDNEKDSVDYLNSWNFLYDKGIKNKEIEEIYPIDITNITHEEWRHPIKIYNEILDQTPTDYLFSRDMVDGKSFGELANEYEDQYNKLINGTMNLDNTSNYSYFVSAFTYDISNLRRIASAMGKIYDDTFSMIKWNWKVMSAIAKTYSLAVSIDKTANRDFQRFFEN